MKTFATLILCPLAALGASATAVPTGPYTAGVWRVAGDSDVHFAGTPVNASGGKFWVNRETSAYCPDGIEGLDCAAYPGSQTVFVDGNQTLSLNVAVPGGQQVYIDDDGSLSYTQPHSGAIPEGSITTGFEREQSQSSGAPINLYNTEKLGWLVCPVTEGEPTERVYQIFAGWQKDGCYSTTIRTYTAEGVNAWEYM